MKKDNNSLQEDIRQSMKMTNNIFETISLTPSKDYYRKQHLEILKLEYDKATKFFAMWNATSMWYTTLTLGLLFNGNFTRGLFIFIQLLWIIWRTLHRNFKTNNIFDVLKERIIK